MKKILPRPTELSPGQWDCAVELWRLGYNTWDIAFRMSRHESLIYNGLSWRRKEFEVAA